MTTCNSLIEYAYLGLNCEYNVHNSLKCLELIHLSEVFNSIPLERKLELILKSKRMFSVKGE